MTKDDKDELIDWEMLVLHNMGSELDGYDYTLAAEVEMRKTGDGFEDYKALTDEALELLLAYVRGWKDELYKEQQRLMSYYS